MIDESLDECLGPKRNEKVISLEKELFLVFYLIVDFVVLEEVYYRRKLKKTATVYLFINENSKSCEILMNFEHYALIQCAKLILGIHEEANTHRHIQNIKKGDLFTL